jgi:hypothetical protein
MRDPAKMRLPFKRLETELVRSLKRSYREIIKAHSDETLYAFGFYIMSDSCGVLATGNTEELLQATHEKYNDGDDMRWHFGDWGILDEPVRGFDAVNEILEQMSDRMPSGWDWGDTSDPTVTQLFETFISSLQIVHQSGLLGSGKERLRTVLMPVGDVEGNYMYRAISRCNPASITRKMRFLKG